MAGDPLSLFHPLIARWFAERYGAPTAVQAAAWPRIARGEHVLLTAPTGSGKTLAAFLWAVNRLVTGAWEPGRVRVLYVSPLKALGTDVRRNLEEPLAELRGVFAAGGEVMPAIRALTRSGDTPQKERRRMLQSPPEILITTPESLNILLTSVRGRQLLGGVATVILDEVHAVVGGKRGVHLITAVERLVPLAGEFQRIALSATVRPLERVARWVGGFERVGTGPDSLQPRPVALAAPSATKHYELSVAYPAGSGGTTAASEEEAVWAPLTRDLRERIRANRSTLVFANSRRTVEKLTRMLNEAADGELAYSHHGSLSHEVRAVVEERLKAGALPAIVATSSLELGIDIGALDEVVLVQTPPSVASAVQRLGRAGHGVGETSRGRLEPLYPRDLLQAAVVARAVLEGDIEEVRPLLAPLDVLAQVVLSMVANQEWALDDLYDQLRTSTPYHGLPRRAFDLVVEMLAGRFAATRVRELDPLVSLDRVAGTVRGRPGADRIVYLSGGTIPDRGYFHLRLEGSLTKIGELDEEFVWERSVGDTFTLGVQTWRVERITHNDVVVSPAHARSAMAPFWRADARDRSFHLSDRVGRLLEALEPRLGEPGLKEELARTHRLEPAAADALVELLADQRTACAGLLPHRHRVVIEHLDDPTSRGDLRQAVVHTFWGGRVNRAFGFALAAAWEERHGSPLAVEHDDDCLLVTSPAGAPLDQLVDLVSSTRSEELVRRGLGRTGFFGARFREAAGVALLLRRESFRRRTPLWFNRQRSKQLLQTVSRFDDFPVILEAWRTCLEDELDLGSLAVLLDEVARGEITVRHVCTEKPSPFAANVMWRQTNRLMYEDDTPEPGGAAVAREDLLRELVFSSRLRPRLSPALVEAFQRRLHRVEPGWTPRDGRELADWVEERLLMPDDEWHALLAAMDRDGHDANAAMAEAAPRLARVIRQDGRGRPLVCGAADLALILAAVAPGDGSAELSSPVPGQPAPARPRLAAPAGEEVPEPLAALVSRWLQSYGPVPHTHLANVLGLDADAEREVLETLVAEQAVVVDQLLEDSDDLQLCDAENLERLLRQARAAARPQLEPRGPEHLAVLLAHLQHLGSAGAGPDDLRTCLETLFAYPAPARLWEKDILPARLDPYYPDWIDALLGESELEWVGCGKERLAFALSGDLDLVRDDVATATRSAAVDEVLPPVPGRFELTDLAAHSGLGSAELSRRLWRLAWRGMVATDSFAPVRRGLATRFAPVEVTPTRPGRSAHRMRFARWQASRPFVGTWHRLPASPPPEDAVAAEELAKERARLLLERYGVLFRELSERELPALSWPRIFRALRLMELSGEIVAGHFFTGVRGLQFASHAAVRLLLDGLPGDRVVWMSAADPASLCGLGLEGLDLPHRLPSNHLVFHGPQLVLVSQRRGRTLDVHVPADHPRLEEYLGFLKVLLTRQVDPERSLTVETVNNEPAAAGPFAPLLRRLFDASAYRGGLRLSRRY